MSIRSLDILARVAAELLARSSATKRYLDKIGPGETGEHTQLIQTIRTALDSVEQLLPATLESAVRFISKGEHGSALGIGVLDAYLGRFSRWFKTIHELLVYLPRQAVTKETVSVLASSFGEMFRSHKPSIILGSLFNALEFDFFQIVRDRLPDLGEIVTADSRNIVLQLAICDRDSPHAWAILAHEMGHAIDLHEGISGRTASKFVKDMNTRAYQIVRSWCQELCADLIAAKALGPSPILALLSLEYCIFPLAPIFLSSETHPSTRWRLAIVSEFLQEAYPGLDLLQEEILFYNAAAEYNLTKNVSDPGKRREIREGDERQFRFIIQPIASTLREEVSEVRLPHHTMDLSSLDRCSRRLCQNSPISAQGLSREDLRTEISSYKQFHFASAEDRQKMFQILMSKFKEEPLNMPSILLSSFRQREVLIRRATERVDLLKEPDTIRKLCDDLGRLDELVASSVNTSSVHGHLRKGATDALDEVFVE